MNVRPSLGFAPDASAVETATGDPVLHASSKARSCPVLTHPLATMVSVVGASPHQSRPIGVRGCGQAGKPNNAE